MPSRQQLLGQIEEPRGRGRPAPRPPQEGRNSQYPPEVKGKAYNAFLDGKNWADCARAIGHKDPNGAGMRLVQRWAEEDHWQRPCDAGDYKAQVERERNSDPERISSDVDQMCAKMQKICDTYIDQFYVVDPETGEGRILIPANFQSRNFADMAAALRMIQETRIKIRKSNEPKDGDKDGKKTDLLTVIREAGLNRIAENRRRGPVAPPPEEDDNSDAEGSTEETYGESSPVAGFTIADIRARLESAAAGAGGAEAGSVEADPGPDGQC